MRSTSAPTNTGTTIFKLERGINDIDGHKAAIENLTLADFNNFLKTLNVGKNRIEVIQTGVEEK